MASGGDWRQRAVVGQPFTPSARAHNEFIDAATAIKQRQRIPGASRVNGVFPEGLVLVKNDSEEDANAFDVLGIDATLFTPAENLGEFQRNPVLSCSTPVVPDHTGKFVILYEAIPAGNIGRAWLHGTCRVQIDVGDEGDEFADVADGIATKLTSGSSGGVQILHIESGTGTKWAVVRFGASGELLPPGGLKYMCLQRLDDGPEEADPPYSGGTAGWDWVRAHGGETPTP